jgi:activator of 2-hydroxyglutaryl-CoA dehydratase/predicted nucleotide-binding protein (sugar kinase/HSP70/actin superfamily)
MIGLDVGSTTVKAVVVDPSTSRILWKDYQRHETKQPEKALEFLQRIEQAFPEVPMNAFRLLLTGSGGSALQRHVGGRFVQEVNAVSLAVEKMYPEVQSVVELGGQDAKIIIFKEDPETHRKKKIPTMNDKCAGGTGAVLDKIGAKLCISPEQLCRMGYDGIRIHPVAGKCGVFAETDINGLQKGGVPADELMASLFESLILQNISVLTRGHTLRPSVLLLGGPNTFIRGMQECWRHNIPRMWAERNVKLPPGRYPEDLIIVPDNAQYFAAIGAIEFARLEVQDDPDYGLYHGREVLDWYLRDGRLAEKRAHGLCGLVRNQNELEAFKERYRIPPWEPARYRPGAVVEAFVGLDGGSTSTKAVLMDTDLRVVAKAYQLSKGNPIEDTRDMFAALREQVEGQGARLEILGVATTGYAKDILRDVIAADLALVETVAHTMSGLHYYPGADVIVDVGGQDIKLIILANGQVKDFKLNTQCSAGNGYFLQSTAGDFGYSVEDYADVAFTAEAMPEFGYGCAVFLQSDIVDFQRQGWQANEIMAGLAAVLPKNVWLYVSQIPNLARLGTRFILQGGTQRNLAAVKAQVDFIEGRFKSTGLRPDILVHKHCGESGAIGCALEAHRLWRETGRRTTFIGLDAVQQIEYRTTRNEDTRCFFCKNKCLRTFVDVRTGQAQDGSIDVRTQYLKQGAESGHATRLKHGRPQGAADGKRLDSNRPRPGNGRKTASRLPLRPGEQRLIIATCEKGTVEDVDDMRQIARDLEAIKAANPNMTEIAAREAFSEPVVQDVSDRPPTPAPWKLPKFRRRDRRRRELMNRRQQVRIGMPRVLNMYGLAPFYLGFFKSLGVPYRNIVWSHTTTEELYRRGAKRGSIDPCYPSKLAIPHVHDLLHVQHARTPLTHIFFPMVDCFPTFLQHTLASKACPTVVGTVEATHAAFIKEGDLFAERGITFKKTFLNVNEPLLCARQMYGDWKDEMGFSPQECVRGVHQGLQALRAFIERMRRRSREIIDRLEAEGRVGIVALGRPYHNDPGVNHGICQELQKLGYPILWQDALPIDDDILERLFGEEVAAGGFASPLSIEDVWKNSYSENSNRKLWAAKYVARHPNLVALELSSFKCGHDAPIYSAVEQIVERSGTPYFSFKDIDENKPAGSIKIRIETVDYFLRRHRQNLLHERRKVREVEARLAEYVARLQRQGQTAAGASDVVEV